MGLLPNPVGNLPPELRLDGITLPDAQGFWLREQFERGALRDPELIQGLLEQARRSALCFTVLYCALLCFTVLYFALLCSLCFTVLTVRTLLTALTLLTVLTALTVLITPTALTRRGATPSWSRGSCRKPRTARAVTSRSGSRAALPQETPASRAAYAEANQQRGKLATGWTHVGTHLRICT